MNRFERVVVHDFTSNMKEIRPCLVDALLVYNDTKDLPIEIKKQNMVGKGIEFKIHKQVKKITLDNTLMQLFIDSRKKDTLNILVFNEDFIYVSPTGEEIPFIGYGRSVENEQLVFLSTRKENFPQKNFSGLECLAIHELAHTLKKMKHCQDMTLPGKPDFCLFCQGKISRIGGKFAREIIMEQYTETKKFNLCDSHRYLTEKENWFSDYGRSKLFTL